MYDYTFNTVGPSYIRLTGTPGCQHVYKEDYSYKFGKNEKIIEGSDVLIISSGSVTSQAKIAANSLKKYNINVGLINCHSIKPFDENIIKEIKDYKYLVVVEEHSIIGGLNSIISELLIKHSIKKRILPITLPDKFGPTGDYNFLIDYHGLSNKIENKIKTS